VQLKLLGSTEFVIGDVRAPLGGPRSRAVLVTLGLHAGRPVTTPEIIDDLWGESAPASAAHTVETYISRLRKVLNLPGEPIVIARNGSGYVLNLGARQVDALWFAELAAQGRTALAEGDTSSAEDLLSSALALWRGPALADVRDATFAPAAARGLENERLVVVETLIDARLLMGCHVEVLSDLESVIAAEPFRERFHAQLMTALYRSGRQVDALAAYQRARELLADEHGLEPGRELRELEQAILRQAPELEPVIRPFPRDAAVRPPENEGLRPKLDHAGSAALPRAKGWSSRLRWRAKRGWIATAAVLGLLASFVLPIVLSRTPAGAGLVAVGISELNTASGGRSRTLPLPSAPGGAASGDGSVWVTSPEGHVLYRIDPLTGLTTDTIPVGSGAGAIVVAGSDIWVANALDGTLSEVSSETNSVVGVVAVGPEPSGIAFSHGAIWVTDATAGTLAEVNASSGQVTTKQVSTPPFGVALGAGSVWVSDPGEDEITRIDPHGGPPLQISVGSGPTAITFGLGSVWVTNGLDSTVSRINPATDTVAATIPVGDGPDALAIVGNSVWVANGSSSTLTKIDATANSATTSMPMGGSPVALTCVGKGLWVATRPPANSPPRGGALRVVQSVAAPSIDPALASPAMPFQFFEGTYDTLVTSQRVGGTGGLQLVPDLALTVPVPTDGGMVYTFVLRPGVRYSNGQLVRPEDFRYGIERVLELNSAAAPFLTGIIGAAACRPGKPCDLSQGITISDSADTVTFHLTAPDTQFLDTLTAWPTAPVPSGVPDHDVGIKPVPATGPYEIGLYLPGREVEFVRNPYFHEWSAAAEPAGSPDSIVWTFGASISEEMSEIETGRADWTDDSVPGVAGLLARFPAQLHVNPASWVLYASFNTRVAPFNSLLVRQAFSLAADRAKLVQLLGGPSAASPTCQILPPDIPGYRPYCPFTVDPNPAGSWVGPDVGDARKLVAESGTSGMRITLWAPQGMGTVSAFIVSVLRELGYRASMITPPSSVWQANVNDSRRGVQAVDTSWLAPTAYDFLARFFRCSSFRLADPGATNDGSFFCDPTIDRLMDAAEQEGPTDPDEADATWAQVDREVTDAAPWVPLVSVNWVDFLSARLGGYQYDQAFTGPLLDQMFIRH
jgi:YVTN family beta-propeller protein